MKSSRKAALEPLVDLPSASPVSAAGRFVRYAGVGAVATAAPYAVLVGGVELGGLPAWIGSGLGAAVGAQVAFAGNRWFTFAHRGPLAAAWLRFQATAVVGALLGMAVVGVGVRLGAGYLAAQVVATLLALLLTFAINRRWTFIG